MSSARSGRRAALARITIASLFIPAQVADHMWEKHRIDDVQVLSLPSRFHVVIRNHGRAPYRLIGRDDQGRCIAAPIHPTDDWLTWRVASAWYCDQDEANRLRP